MPLELTGLQFYNKGKVGREKTFFVFLEWTSCFRHPLRLQVEQGSFLVPTWSHSVHKLLFFSVGREHVLGVPDLLSSLGSIWRSCHHYYTGGTSRASAAWFCG